MMPMEDSRSTKAPQREFVSIDKANGIYCSNRYIYCYTADRVIPKGPILMADLLALLPFPDTVCTGKKNK